MKLKFFSAISFILISLLIYGLYISQQEIRLTDPIYIQQLDSKYYDYKGITNIQSQYGQGSGSIEHIVNQAHKTNIDFITVTDTNPYKESHNYEGYYDNLILLEGGKYSYLQSTLLYYPNENYKLRFSSLSNAQTYFTDMLSQDSPQDFITLTSPNKKHTWLEHSFKGLSGVEVINLRRIWRNSWKKNKWNFLLSLWIYPFHSDYALIRLYQTPVKELQIWDELQQKSPSIVGFLGNDISAKSKLFGSEYYLRFPSYLSSFQFASNHILTKSELTGIFVKDKEKILSSLQSGQFYMCFDVLGNPKGFYAEMISGNRTYPLGSSVKLNKNLRLKIQLPKKLHGEFLVQVFRNGSLFTETNNLSTNIQIHLAGNYRVLVKVRSILPFPDHKDWLDWIYTNSFSVQE